MSTFRSSHPPVWSSNVQLTGSSPNGRVPFPGQTASQRWFTPPGLYKEDHVPLRQEYLLNGRPIYDEKGSNVFLKNPIGLADPFSYVPPLENIPIRMTWRQNPQAYQASYSFKHPTPSTFNSSPPGNPMSQAKQQYNTAPSIPQTEFDPSRRNFRLNVDNPITQEEQGFPTGRRYVSETSTTTVPGEPHIKSNARFQNNGVETMITVSVKPTDSSITNMPNIVSYETSMQFFNETCQSIRITDRNNVTVTLHGHKHFNQHKEEFLLVRKIHRFVGIDNVKSVIHNFQKEQSHIRIDNHERHQVLTHIEELYRSGYLKNNNVSTEIRVDRLVPLKLFENYASIYVSEIDLLFSQTGIDLGTPHPMSQDALLESEILRVVGSYPIAGMAYVMIDNESSHMARFICLGSKVVKIPIIRNKSYRSGIYSAHIDNTRRDCLRSKVEYHPFEESEQLGIYTTEEEAEKKGNVGVAANAELARAKIELAKVEQKTAMLNAQAKEAQTQREEAEERIKHSRHLEKLALERDAASRELEDKIKAREKQDEYERRSQERKDHYEEKSYSRRDANELLKWIPTFIGAILSVAAILVSMNRKE